MDETFSRNSLFWGEEFQQKLSGVHVAVIGLGGVGGFSAEMLARAGIGTLTIMDFDVVAQSNINRQIIALNSTVGLKKTELFNLRLKDINPDININLINDFYRKNFDFGKVDYVVDAIDSMRAKVDLLIYCVLNNIPVISSLGAGNRLDPTQLYVCDISQVENKNTPFVSNVLYQLKKHGIEKGIEVIVSHENPHAKEKISSLEHVVTSSGEKIEFNKIIPASTPFVAPVVGIIMANRIINQISLM